MSLIDLLPTSKYGFGGKKPPMFDLGPASTLDYKSSINGDPAFITYQDAYLRTKNPTKMTPPATQLKKYLDNPPK